MGEFVAGAFDINEGCRGSGPSVVIFEVVVILRWEVPCMLGIKTLVDGALNTAVSELPTACVFNGDMPDESSALDAMYESDNRLCSLSSSSMN